MADDAHIIVTDSAGNATAFLLRRGTPVRRDPISGQSQVTTVGESERRGDSRTPEVIVTDQGSGMGLFEYEELNGTSAFTDSNCDTRYPGMICLPPARAQIGGALTNKAFPAYIEHIGQTNAQCIVWGYGASSAVVYSYDPVGLAWTNVAALTFVTGFTRYNGLFVMTRATATNAVYTSTDGVTWTARARNKILRSCCVHDNKFYTYNESDDTLDWNSDPTSTTYTSSTAVLKRLNGEAVIQLFEWQRGGRAMIFLLTNFRLLWYDEDADVFLAFDDSWAGLVLSSWLLPRATVWGRTGDLYITFYNAFDASMQSTAMHYSGQREALGPNSRGGMTQTSRVALTHLVGGQQWLFAFGARAYGLGSTNTGRVMAVNEQGGWHTLTTGSGTSTAVLGGGYARGLLWTLENDGKVYQQAVPDEPTTPLLRASGEITYPTTGTYTHEYAFTDAGRENMPKLALWLTVQARDMTSTYKKQGTPANTSIVLDYLLDTSTAWTTAATLTSASTFPAVIPLQLPGAASGSGIPFKQLKWRLTLATTSANNTPIVTSTALAYLVQEQPRDAYTLEIDLRDRNHPLYREQDVYQLLAKLETYRAPGALVKLQFAGGDWATVPASGRTIANCQFSFGGVELADAGPGVYSCQFSDLTPPASG